MESGHVGLRSTALLSISIVLLGVPLADATARPGGGGRDRPPVAFDFPAPSIFEDGSAVVALSYSDPDGDLASDCSMSSSTIRFTRSCRCDDVGSCTVEVQGLADANGPASFQYDVTAKRKTSNSATVTIEVVAVNDAPVASAFTHPTFAADTEELVTLPYTDPDDLAQSCSVGGLENVVESSSCQCAAGVCTVAVRGLAGYTGSASFQFTISDGVLVSLPATASLGIGPGVVGMRIPGESDLFGFSVAAFGNRFVAGAPGEGNGRVGAAYVYRDPTSDGDWSDRQLEARLEAPDGQAGDFFGAVVAMEGDVIAVLEDTESWFPATPNRLHVFVDEAGSGNWVARNLIERPESAGHWGGAIWTGPGFDSLDIDGARIVVGAFQDSAQSELAGAVYVYEDPGADRDWDDAAVTRVAASDPQSGASYGISLAIDGDVMAVGAPGFDSKSKGPLLRNSGAVYIYRHDGSGWREEARLWASDRSEDLRFGSTVDVEGDTLVVAAEGGTGPGGVYVLQYDGAQWVEQIRIQASNGDTSDRLGSAGVKLVGSKIFIATPFEDGELTDPGSNDFVNSGALYLVQDPDADGDWSNAVEFYLKPQVGPSLLGETHDYFGCSFDVAGSTLVVGAFDEDGDGALPPNDALHDSGAVYLFIDPNGDGQWADWLEHLYAK